MKFAQYAPALIAGLIAVASLVIALTSGAPEDRLSASAAAVDGIAHSADLTRATSLERGDFVVCVTSSAASSAARATAESLRALDGGACLLPDVVVDIQSCLELDHDVAEGRSVPAAVQSAISPVLSVIAGIAGGSKNEKVSIWALAALKWVEGAAPSIIALIEDPSKGALNIPAVEVDCQ